MTDQRTLKRIIVEQREKINELETCCCTPKHCCTYACFQDLMKMGDEKIKRIVELEMQLEALNANQKSVKSEYSIES